MDPWIRVTDADRERVVAVLRDQVGTGRLSLDEFSERSAATYQARTGGDLDALTRDLPSPTPAPATNAQFAFGPVLALVVAALLLGVAFLAIVGVITVDSMGSMIGRMHP